MMHRVTCMDCGKTERIEVEHHKKIESGWVYYGKLNLNSCKTDKVFYKIREGGTMLNLKDWIKVPNICYDPTVKPKNVELWECPECHKKDEKK